MTQQVVVAGVAVVAGVLAFAAVARALARRRRSTGMEYSYSLEAGERFRHRWGFTDTRFVFDGPRRVRVTGNRYPLSGTVMPGFVPFAEEVLQVSLRPEDMASEVTDRQLPPPVLNSA